MDLAAAAVLSASHPFTGLSLGLLLVVYAALELVLKSGAASWRLLWGTCAIPLLHLGYYVVFLNRFADHRALEAQWELDWPYMFLDLRPGALSGRDSSPSALSPVGRICCPALAQPRMRLCLVGSR